MRRYNFRASFCPVSADDSDERIQSFVEVARQADIVIAEVGTWSNPLSSCEKERHQALEKCKEGLALAERVGALCCVNIAGSRAEQWDGPHPSNLTQETFDLIVDSVREIIDSVQPKRTFYTLETMPWIYPDSPDNYLRLLRAIERPQFAVHLDPVNLICSPQRLFDNSNFIRECFATLGPYIKSCHAKDITLASRLTVHLDEVRPGLGELNYHTFVSEFAALNPDTPLMLEHLANEEEYALAAAHIRAVAIECKVTI